MISSNLYLILFYHFLNLFLTRICASNLSIDRPTLRHKFHPQRGRLHQDSPVVIASPHSYEEFGWWSRTEHSEHWPVSATKQERTVFSMTLHNMCHPVLITLTQRGSCRNMSSHYNKTQVSIETRFTCIRTLRDITL